MAPATILPISKMADIAFPPSRNDGNEKKSHSRFSSSTNVVENPADEICFGVSELSQQFYEPGWQAVEIEVSAKRYKVRTDGGFREWWAGRHALPENGSDYGPMTDLPDWSFADGRPAPPMKGYLRRQEKNREFARRIAMISSEIDRGMEKWETNQREQRQQAEEKRQNRLLPKGGSLPPLPK
uniref:Uncharacterized protein n=1 Tax=Sphaerodactylus townsendi TaxID=933632 RepID=A0ACB8EW90_9SAUR